MKTNFQVEAIDVSEINHLFQLGEEELSNFGAEWKTVNRATGYPCRVSLQESPMGEEVLLFAFKHHPVSSPYQASGPVFVRKNVETARLKPNELPAMLQSRLLSLRGYNRKGNLEESRTVEGKQLRGYLEEVFENQNVKYIHIHNSGAGCYMCNVKRVN
ncbi:DUF1203 domain-containing protein [Rapidithrix thailandica]|uniref:DUF1203 domain-containing protein n=1 Tax=Rapidithrix thailandica TaxID=413964 RepID=A0AAW9SF00_9BACT